MSQYSIKDLEKLSGIKAHTIRIWEKRYTLLNPERTETNIRHYSDEDLKKILNVASLVKNGMKISKISRLCEETVRDEVLKIDRKQTLPDLRIDQLVRLMIDMNTAEFELTLNKIFSEIGVENTITKVLFPFMERIGLLWQIGSIIPAHEHFVSNLIRNKLISETDKLSPQISSKTMLLFLKEDELHELSLLFYNFLAKKNGFRTVYLGSNVPFQNLVEISGKYQFEAVLTVFVNALEKDLLEAYMQQLTVVFRNKKIFVSGLQIKNNNPKIPLGVTLVENAESFISGLNLS